MFLFNGSRSKSRVLITLFALEQRGDSLFTWINENALGGKNHQIN